MYLEKYNYCPNCSQKSKLHRLTFHDIVHEGIHYFTHADKGLFQLIRDLVKKGGVVAREYLDGKRKKYFPPLSFFLVIAAIFVFMANIGENKPVADVAVKYPHLSKIEDPIEKQLKIQAYTRAEKAKTFTVKYSNMMAMCALPLTALVFWLLYFRHKYNYVEHLVAGMYMLGICMLVFAVVIMPLSYLFNLSMNYAYGLFGLLQLIYFAVFYYAFLAKKTKLQFIGAFGASFLSLAVWIIVSNSIVRLYINNGFWGILE
jgi:hypothetical protein